MFYKEVFVAYTKFCQLHLCSRFLENNCEEKEAWKSAKKNLLAEKNLKRISFIPWIQSFVEPSEMV